MLLITCPWCGPRDEVEFAFGGPSDIDLPADPKSVDDRTWAEYLFMRGNVKGPQSERWVHIWGCRQWFNAIRDTVSHDVLATYRLDEGRPIR